MHMESNKTKIERNSEDDLIVWLSLIMFHLCIGFYVIAVAEKNE